MEVFFYLKFQYASVLKSPNHPLPIYDQKKLSTGFVDKLPYISVRCLFPCVPHTHIHIHLSTRFYGSRLHTIHICDTNENLCKWPS